MSGPRRIFTGLLAGLVFLTLAGCGGRNGDSGRGGRGAGGGGSHGTSGSGGQDAGPSNGGGTGTTAAPSGDTGVVVGTVRFEGAPPSATLNINKPECAAHHGGATEIEDPSYRLGANGAVPNAIVWIDGLRERIEPAPRIELDQKNCLYSRVVMPMAAGTTVVIHNSDDTVHNVKWSSRANGTDNINQAPGDAPAERVFRLPEPQPFEIVCDVHGWMRLWAHVLPHSRFAVSGDDGSFRIEGVPVGRRTVMIWHPRFGATRVEVEVQKDAEARADATLRGGR